MRSPRSLALVIALAVAGALAGCAPTGSDASELSPEIVPVNPELATDPDVPVVEDLVYGEVDGVPLVLDACLPPEDSDGRPDPDAGPRAAIVSIHGGSWARGDKAGVAWRAVCQWLARAGYPTFSVNYRLAPGFVFPAAFEDVSRAVEWLREPSQTARFDIDPDRIGVFGGSAGGNLAAMLGTAGSGDLTTGSRVAAVAELSGPVDLTGRAVTDDFVPVQLAYLGCATQSDCPAARSASPVYAIDETDPPFFVAHSTDELIPLAQSERLVAELREAGIDVDFVTVEGRLHSIAMLDAEVKSRIVAFFDRTLGRPVGILD
jgi:acetyl esterase/lipase